jgi:hypothetical protein
MAANATTNTPYRAQLVMLGGGIVVTIGWLYVAWVQVSLTMRALVRLCREHIPEYDMIVVGRNLKGRPGPDRVLGRFAPVLFLVLWSLLLVERILRPE